MNTNETMNVKFSELGKKTDACTKKRSTNVILGTASTPTYNKTKVVGEALRAMLMGTEVTDPVTGAKHIEYLDKNDLKAVYAWFSLKFRDIGYDNGKQAERNAERTAKEVLRYVNWISAKSIIFCKGREEELQGKINVVVRPDFIYSEVNDKGEVFLTVVKLKQSRPIVTQAKVNAGKDSLDLYALLCYGRDMVKNNPKATKVTVSAEVHYLRRADDRFGANPHFNAVFADTRDGGGNRLCLCETVDKANPNCFDEVDALFAGAIDQFTAGIPEHECNKEDCEKCELYDMCKYSLPPIPILKESVVKGVRDMNLTKAQEEAVNYTKGICRINAGAGSGKTTVVSLRTVMLFSMGVLPEQIALFTFTNAAAEEMRSRIKAMSEDFGLSIDVDALRAMTFNAFGDEIIKKEYKNFGFSREPKVIDDEERSIIIADILSHNEVHGLDYMNFNTDIKTCRGALAMAKLIFDIVKRERLTCSDRDVNTLQQCLENNTRFISDVRAYKELINLYEEYNNKLTENGLIEFSDQEVLVQDLLHKNPFYLERFGFKHVIVDEFQDSSAWQIELIRKFTETADFQSLMVVGDDSQSIYGFRNTSPEYIINFKKYIGQDIDDIFLLENHRSTPEIIEFANKINALNTNRVEKDLVATRASGRPVYVSGFYTKQEEKDFVLNSIKEHLTNGTKPEDMAIICSTKYELQDMADVLTRNNIPSVMLNPEPLMENSRVRAAIAFSNAVQNIFDTQDMLTYANACMRGGLLELSDAEIEKKVDEVNQIVAAINAIGKPSDRKTALLEKMKEIDESDEVYESFLNTLEFKSIDQIFEYCNKFYDYGTTSAVRRIHDYPGVVLTTAHSSKGLEWPVVYNMISKFESSELGVGKRHASQLREEKRRLFFVTATRARDELYVTSQYIAYGKAGAYVYNKFLMEAMKAVGQEFSTSTVETQLAARKAAEKADRAAAKAAANTAKAAVKA